MSKVFCQCDKCERDILVGETMVSLTMTRDEIIDESCLQPTFANSLGTWCQPCASKELKKHVDEFKTQINDSGENDKRCPFCGSEQLSVETLKSAWGTGDSEDHVVCDDCAASAPKDVWNDKKGSENA